MNRAKSVEIDSSRLGLNNDEFSIHVNNESHHENNDSGDSKEGTPMRSFSRTDENRRSKKSNKSEKSTKSTKASLTLPLDMNKVRILQKGDFYNCCYYVIVFLSNTFF